MIRAYRFIYIVKMSDSMVKDLDKKFMKIALEEAEKAYAKKQLPIGAVLVIDNKLVEVNSNTQVHKGDWFHHAENILIQKNGKLIKKASMAFRKIELYTTLEPCLMCFGAAVHNRLTRIVYACQDPSAGYSNIKPPTEWYAKRWPGVVSGPFSKESFNLFVKFMEENPKSWSNVLPLYYKLKPNNL